MNLLRSTQLIATAFAFSFLAACSDSGGGPGVPQDAATINVDNALVIASDALATTDDGIDDYFPKSGTQVKGGVINIKSQISKYTELAISKTDTAAGVTETFDCWVSGQIIISISGSATSGSITMDFNNCNDGLGDIVDGVITFSGSIDGAFELETATFTGNLSVTDIATQVTIELIGMNFRDTFYVAGVNVGDYTSYANYAISGIPFIGGYLFETLTTIEGTSTYDSFWNAYIPDFPTAGQVRISGSNGTKLLITFNSNQTVTIELDDGTGGGYVFFGTYTWAQL